jgi:hypothetical protein
VSRRRPESRTCPAFLTLRCCADRHVSDPVLVAKALQQVWPLLRAVIDCFHGDYNAIEHLARCPRNALRTAGAAIPFHPHLARLLHSFTSSA